MMQILGVILEWNGALFWKRYDMESLTLMVEAVMDILSLGWIKSHTGT